MLTKIKFYKKLADANFQLCSKTTVFAKVFGHFSKLDIFFVHFYFLDSLFEAEIWKNPAVLLNNIF